MDKVANIDGDILLYAIGSFKNDHPFLKDKEGEPVQMPCSTEAVQGYVDKEVERITEGAGCTSYKIFLSGDSNFRDQVAKTYTYKGKREGFEKPYHYQTVKDYLLSSYDPVVSDNREADDELAEAQTESTVLCSLDKDLLMVAGWHYNWRKEELRHVSYEQAYRWFMYQLLVGDWSTDAILGCGVLKQGVYGPKAAKAGQPYIRREGVGPKAAENLLSGAIPELLDTVVLQYKSTFGDEWKTKLNEMATLLGMGLSEDNQWSYDERKDDYRKAGHGCLGEEVNNDSDEALFRQDQ